MNPLKRRLYWRSIGQRVSLSCQILIEKCVNFIFSGFFGKFQLCNKNFKVHLRGTNSSWKIVGEICFVFWFPTRATGAQFGHCWNGNETIQTIFARWSLWCFRWGDIRKWFACKFSWILIVPIITDKEFEDHEENGKVTGVRALLYAVNPR